MNVAYVNLFAGLGGHTRTSITVAQALQERGHTITFVVGKTSDDVLVRKAGFDVRRTGSDWLGRYRDLEALLGELHAECRLDAVHSFHKEGIAEAVRASKRLGIPFFWTICGGPPSENALEVRSIISLSHEVKAGLLKTTALTDEDIAVIPARIDTRALLGVRERLKENGSAHLATFRDKYGIPSTAAILLRVARCSLGYESSVVEGIEAVVKLRERGVETCFVHIGYAESELVCKRIKARMERANRRFGCVVAVTAQDEAANALHYYEMADVAVGTGRSAFEPMLYGKPTLISSANSAKKGFAGLVQEKNIEEIAFYNFSGRNLKVSKSYETSAIEMARVIQMLLHDQAFYHSTADFGRRYVLRNLDAVTAAGQYESLYERFEADKYPTDAQLDLALRIDARRVRHALLPSTLRHRILEGLREFEINAKWLTKAIGGRKHVSQ